MKIVTWNCNGKFREKFHEISKLKADIYLIQECENPAASTDDYKLWAGDHIWIGDNKHKGLAIFTKGPKIEKLEWDANNLKLFLPVRISDKFNLIGVWTKANHTRQSRYIGQFWHYLQLHKIKISNYPIVISGDFNSNKIWDYKPRDATHSDVVMALKEFDILSLYHLANAENQGEETQPTFFLHKNHLKSYHIDYSFLSQKLKTTDFKKTISIGKKDDWLAHSDHMPVEFLVNDF